ncbi:flippase-like domain-containing protein [Halorarius litoreus]|uniref:flippase-like domain-containing protein n=1 Tax=Halorarius litoreus TaxID=2962676 RepID=UPI0020CF2209|nr:flippase-like domain-containing protein [Halorarius litoreus]
MNDVEVSVVLPAYNEEATIEHTVEVTLSTLASFLPDDAFEVIVAEDGCEDRTPEIADRLAAEDPRVRHFHSDERLGRGGALERAFEASHGDTLVYFDTDLATDMQHLEELVESVRSEGYDVVTGSRRIPGEKQDREPERGVASTGYNSLVKLFLRSDLYDHQCGFKAFDREALFALLEDVEDDHWFWDTEVLVRAQRAGYRVKEFPVDWTPKGDTKVDLVRDVFGMGSQILRVWWEFSVRPRATRRVALAAGTLLIVAALALMTVYLDPSDVLAAIGGADLRLVAAAALVYALSWPLRGARYRDILAELGYDGELGFLTGAIFISQTGNLVFPARAGDAVRAYVLKARRGVPYPSGFASLAVERVFDLLTITVLAGTVLLGFAAVGLDPSLAGTSDDVVASGRTALLVAAGVGVAAVLAVGVIVASARSDRDFVRAALDRVSDDSYVELVAEVVGSFVADVQAVAANRDAFLRVGGSSLLIWTLDVVTAILVFQAFTTTPGVPDVPLVPLVALSFFAVSVGNLAKVLPLSPGGIGLYEGAFTLLVVVLTPALAGVTLTAAVALAVAVVDHAVKNVVTVIGGVASTLVFNVSLTKAVDEASEAEQRDGLATGERGGTTRE